MSYAIDLKSNEHVELSVRLLDGFGTPVPTNVNNPPAWSVSDTNIITLSDVAASGLTATIAAAGTPGTATVTVTLDVIINSQTVTLTVTRTIIVRNYADCPPSTLELSVVGDPQT